MSGMYREPYPEWYAAQAELARRAQAAEYQKVLNREAEERRVQALVEDRKRECEREAERCREAKVAALLLMKTDAVAGVRALGDALAREHNIRLQWKGTTIYDARAIIQARQAFVPVPTPATAGKVLGVVVHELAHIINGPCPRIPPHQSRRTEHGTDSCLQCEVNADLTALRLLELDATQHGTLASGLETYLHKSAPIEAQRQARAFIAGTTWRLDRHRRMKHQLRQDAINEMRAWAEEAARPRPLSRLEQQIADVRRWAAEDRR